MIRGDAEWVAFKAQRARRHVYTYSLGTTVVYVGSTQQPRERRVKHQTQSAWLLPCMTFDIVSPKLPRKDGLALEIELIHQLRPMFNIQGNFDYLEGRRGGRPRKTVAA